MRILNRVVLIFLASFLAVGGTSCSLIGVPDSTLVDATPVSITPTTTTDITPLFVPQSDTVIESVNAGLLAPSDGVTFPAANGFTWLPNNQGAALANQEDVLLLPGSQAGIITQSSIPEVTKTIPSTTPSLLIASNKAAVIAWVSGGATINTLDLSSASSVPATIQSESPVTGLALSSSGDKVAYITFNGTTVVQQLGHTQGAASWTLPTWLANLSFSPDGSQLAGADLENFTIYFVNTDSGEVMHKLEWLDSATPALYGVYLAPDWGQVAWVAQNAVQIMDTDDGSIGPLLMHQDVVRSVSWSPDGRLLATGAATFVADKLEPAVMIWDAGSGELLNTLVQQVAVQSVAFSPDGRQLAVLDTNGDLQTWSVSP